MDKAEKSGKKAGSNKPRRVLIIVIGVILLAMIVLQIVGMGFLSKTVFKKGTPGSSEGELCFKMSSAERGLISFAVVILWIGIPFQVYRLVKETCEKRKGDRNIHCGYAVLGYLVAAVITLGALGLVALTRFVFKIKKVGNQYCAVLTKTEHGLARVAIVVVWITLGLFLFDIVKWLITGGHETVQELYDKYIMNVDKDIRVKKAELKAEKKSMKDLQKQVVIARLEKKHAEEKKQKAEAVREKKREMRRMEKALEADKKRKVELEKEAKDVRERERTRTRSRKVSRINGATNIRPASSSKKQRVTFFRGGEL
jgi:hypothetical protein